MENELAIRIEKVLDIARPYLQQDGGDIEFAQFNAETGVLHLRFLGACKTCPMLMMTLRGGVERLIIQNAPEVRRVELAR